MRSQHADAAIALAETVGDLGAIARASYIAGTAHDDLGREGGLPVSRAGRRALRGDRRRPRAQQLSQQPRHPPLHAGELGPVGGDVPAGPRGGRADRRPGARGDPCQQRGGGALGPGQARGGRATLPRHGSRLPRRRLPDRRGARDEQPRPGRRPRRPVRGGARALRGCRAAVRPRSGRSATRRRRVRGLQRCSSSKGATARRAGWPSRAGRRRARRRSAPSRLRSSGSSAYALCQARLPDEARPHFEESLRIARELNVEFEVALTLRAMADVRASGRRHAPLRRATRSSSGSASSRCRRCRCRRAGYRASM